MEFTSRSKRNDVVQRGASCHVHQGHAPPISEVGQSRDRHVQLVMSGLLLLAITIWTYSATIRSLFGSWQKDDDYSAGQLVPLAVAFLVWRDRKTLRHCTIEPCWWGGITLILLAHAARVYGLLFMSLSIDRYSLVVALAGIVLMAVGREVFGRVSWALLFLFLMVPLPGPVHNMIAGPLQKLATTGSVVLLEAAGAKISQQGNVITLGENTPMAVAEACSGLRMLTAFIIVAAFIAYMVKRPRWQKAVLLASSIPVAVICNIVRIFATAALVLHVSSEVGEKFFHDLAGLAMMPAAVLLLFGELWLMDKTIVPEPLLCQAGAQATKPAAPASKACSRETPNCG
jgi:exosortase